MSQRFKLGFRNKSALEQLNICERTVANLAAKPQQQTDPQYLIDASTAVTALRGSHDRVAQLRIELKAEISKRNQLLRDTRNKVSRACLGLSVSVGGDPSKLMEAGFELEKPKNAPVGVPAMPTDFRGEPTETEGEALLRWKRPVRRCWFLVERCTDISAGNWKLIESAWRQVHLVKGLESGGKYWFHICAENSHGKSPWTQPVAVRVK